jgi:hypothetical protein
VFRSLEIAIRPTDRPRTVRSGSGYPSCPTDRLSCSPSLAVAVIFNSPICPMNNPSSLVISLSSRPHRPHNFFWLPQIPSLTNFWASTQQRHTSIGFLSASLSSSLRRLPPLQVKPLRIISHSAPASTSLCQSRRCRTSL